MSEVTDERDEKDVRRLLATVEIRCEARTLDVLTRELVPCPGHGDRVNYLVDVETRSHCPVCSTRQQREIQCRGHLGCLAYHSPGKNVASSLTNGGQMLIVKSVSVHSW